MRKRLWAQIVDVKIAERYYWHYVSVSKRWDKVISAITLFVSASSISAWYIWSKLPGVWAVLIGAAQLVSTFQPLFSFAKRASAATYVQQDLQKLLADMEKAWAEYERGLFEEAALELWYGFETKRREIEDRFAPPELFPQNMRIHDKAQKEAQTYFKTNYDYSEASTGGDR